MEGVLLPVLREEGWPHLDTTAHRRLLAGAAQAGPWVSFALDFPQTVTRVPPSVLETRSLEDLEAEALANLATRPVKIEKMASGAVMVSGEYASEAILLPDVLGEVERLLNAQMIAIFIAKEGGFYALDAKDLKTVAALAGLTRQHFDEATCRRISPVPLIASGGALIGFMGVNPAAAQDDEVEPAPAKPWWRFW